MSVNAILLSSLMLIAGMGIPIMAALNTGLSHHIQSPMAAVLILTAVAMAIAALGMTITARPNLAAISSAPPLYFFAGTLFILYIASITFAAPKIGLGTAVFYVLLGQLISASIIDHFGLWGVPISAITPRRLLGLAFIAFGVYLARKEIIAPIPPP